MPSKKPVLIRLTTVPISLNLLLTGQFEFMQNQGWEVITMSATGPEIDEVLSREKCQHIVIPMTRQITPFKDLYCLFLLIYHFLKIKPEVVHTHTPKAGLLGMMAAKFCGIKCRFHTVAGLPLMTATGGKLKLLTFIEKLTYWSAKKVLPNSYSLYDFIKKNKLTSPQKLEIIGKGSSNGIDLSRFSIESLDAKILEETKATLQFEATKTYFLAVGRVVRDKGIIELVQAFLRVQNEKNNVHLILVGPLERERAEETLPPEIVQIIEENPNITHINWSNHVEYYMHLADVLIHASHREGFPNVPLQAGAMKCPVIVSEIPGNIDIVTAQKTGVIYPCGDETALVEKMNFALGNAEIIATFANNLRTEIEQKYDRKVIHQEILKFYQRELQK